MFLKRLNTQFQTYHMLKGGINLIKMTNYTEYFNLTEKVATLKILIKIIHADGDISSEEKVKIESFLNSSNLVLTDEFINKTKQEPIKDILSNFNSKSNLNKLKKIVDDFISDLKLDPNIEGVIISEIFELIDSTKKEMKFELKNFFSSFIKEFGVLWGKKEIDPKKRITLALIFTFIAGILGSFISSSSFEVLGFAFGEKTTSFVIPKFTAIIPGILIYASLVARNYIPKPTNFQNIIFFLINTYLFSVIGMHIVGVGAIEKTVTIYVFFGLILFMWLGIKELMGVFFLGIFALFMYKIIAIDTHLDARAFPFIVCSILGLSFQSGNFFDDFTSFSNSFSKSTNINKEIAKESIQSSVNLAKKMVV